MARGSTRLLVRPNPATRQGAWLPAAARWLRNPGMRGLQFESGWLYNVFYPEPTGAEGSFRQEAIFAIALSVSTALRASGNDSWMGREQIILLGAWMPWW